jgi:hypothetical protein
MNVGMTLMMNSSIAPSSRKEAMSPAATDVAASLLNGQFT